MSFVNSVHGVGGGCFGQRRWIKNQGVFFVGPDKLGGGFKYGLFSLLFGEDSHFD